MTRTEMETKIEIYVTDSTQRLEVFTGIEMCSSEDLDNAHDVMFERLDNMTDIELENMCNRIDNENKYESYYEIIG